MSTTYDAFCGRLFDQNAFAIKLGLDNMRRAFALQGSPQSRAPGIVVGGTNGKGTVASQVAAILTAHGLRTGLYTSPHLVELRERFRIDGRPVSRDDVLRVGVPLMQRYGEDGADPLLTFFELTTLMAAELFAEANVDAVVWEVGLGGRLDAVNAIEPAVTVITSIDFDHQEHLGDTIEAIAGEKAGLRRDGVPLVLAAQHHAIVEDLFGVAPSAEPARDAARQLLGASWREDDARRGLDAWCWPGRMDRREHAERGWLLDAAHNPAGVRFLRERVEWSEVGAVVVGAMADKDLAGMFGELPQVPVFIAEVASRRAASAAQLRAALGDAAEVRGSGAAAMMFDAASKTVAGTIVVFGSVYLVGEWFAWASVPVDSLVTFLRRGG